jgi:hypothetical protein
MVNGTTSLKPADYSPFDPPGTWWPCVEDLWLQLVEVLGEMCSEVRDGRIRGGVEAYCAYYLVYTLNVYVSVL